MPASSFCDECGIRFGKKSPSQGHCPKCLLKLGMDATDVLLTQPLPEHLNLPSLEELAPLFPQHELVEIIGQGGMGVVYKARHKKLDRFEAIKILRPDLGSESLFTERFQREARALAGLQHTGIVTLYDFGTAGDLYYFAMEYIEGLPLRNLIREKALSPEQALDIVRQICEALQFAHDHGIVHRDVKPDNILVDQFGMVKITDFGLAKLMQASAPLPTLTRTHQAMGTPHYMAPEQIERPLDVDHRADLYSLGVVFYELLTHELPLGHFTMPSEKSKGVDRNLDKIVIKALNKEPESRYQSARDLKAAMSGKKAPKVSKNTPNEVPPPRKKWRRKVVVFAVLIGIAIASGTAIYEERNAMSTPFVIFDSGKPKLSNQARRLFSYDSHIDRAIANGYRRYARIETKFSQVEEKSGGRFTIKIDPFEQEIEILTKQIWQDLREDLSDRDLERLRDYRIIERVLPYGREAVTITVHQIDETSYVVSGQDEWGRKISKAHVPFAIRDKWSEDVDFRPEGYIGD